MYVCMCVCVNVRVTQVPEKAQSPPSFRQVLSQREAASAAALDEANARLKKARQWRGSGDGLRSTWGCMSGQGLFMVNMGSYGFIMAVTMGFKLTKVGTCGPYILLW